MGGVFNVGTLTVTNSTLSDSSATNEGGGIDNSGTLTVTNSTLSGNSATFGGGIDNTGTLTVTNSTLSGNSAEYGGGICNFGTVTVTNSTLSDNSAAKFGGGIYTVNSSSRAILNNTIVAGNGSSHGPDVHHAYGVLSGSFNLIGDGSDQSGIVNGVNGNQVGTSSSPIDPKLSDWIQFDNGLWGYSLLPDSPAINAGSNDLLPDDTYDLDDDGNTSEPIPHDLSGSFRTFFGTVDIGAWEYSTGQFVVVGHLPQGIFLPGQTGLTLLFNRELTTLATKDLTLHGPDGAVPITSVTRIRHGDGWSEYAVRFNRLAKLGEYQLTVKPTVRDDEGGFLDQDLDDTPGESNDDTYVASWSLGGPMVESHAPSGTMPLATPLTHFDMVFSTAMDRGSFSLDDIQTLTGPDGAISPTGHEWLDDRTLRVRFEPVTVAGIISITLGTEVYDQWGNALDQNQNAVAAEADDTWTGSVVRGVSGTIDGDMVVPSNAGEILIDETLSIAAGATLTIEPGVILKFSYGAGLTVNGQLIVLGTVDQPVVFTSSAAVPDPNAWSGIRVTSTGAIKLDHAEVRYAAKAVDANSDGARVVLKNTTLRDGGFGVYVYSPYAEVIAENCLIANNQNTGVFLRADSRHSFKNCTIVGNGFGGSGWEGAGIHLGGSILSLENSIVAFNATGLDHSGDPPTLIVRNSIFYNPEGQEIAWNGDPGMPELGANGNKTIDPLFVDRNSGNYELAASSPAIDAGSGIQTSTTDMLGRFRHDDRGMLNVGNGYPSFVDMGAYERQGDSPMADLAVTYVTHSSPPVVTTGNTFDVEWTVRNVGIVQTTGTWQDFVYFSDDRFLGDDQLLATVDHNDSLAPGASYTETVTVTVPATSGPKYILMHTRLVGNAQREAVQSNNLGVSASVVAVDVQNSRHTPFDSWGFAMSRA